MRPQRLWLIGFVVLLTAQAHAASIRVFCWQLSPPLDVVCFDIDNAPQQARAFTLFGTESVVGSYRYPVTGSVAFDENVQLYRMNWVIYFSALGIRAQASFGANLDPQTLQGPFFSSFGSQGTMLFLGGGAAAAVASAQSVDENQMDQQTLLEQMQ
jgi:hypothetical protein